MPANTISTKLTLAAAAVAATAAIAPATASAAPVTRYATPTGSNSGECLSSGTACSLPRAVSQVAATGDTVSVGSGTYNLTATLSMGANQVTLEGAPGARPVLSFSAAISNARALTSKWNEMTVRHLAIRAPGSGMTGVFGSQLTLDDVDVRTAGSFSEAVLSATAATITNSTIATGSGGRGVRLEGSSNALRHVTIWSGGDGLFVRTAASASNIAVAIVHDSIVHGQGKDIDLSSGGDIGHSAAVNIDHSAFDPAKVGKSDQFAYLNDMGDNVAAPALLANPDAGDFHQLAGSPTIDKGSQKAGDPTTDFDGQARVQGPETDIGADEFTPASVPGGQPAQAGGSSGAATPATSVEAAKTTVAAAKSPVLGALSLTPARFRVATGKAAKKGGTRVAYTDSAAASTRFTVQRRTVRVRRGHRTVRWTSVRGSLTHRDRAGANSVAFSGKWNGRALKPGRYRLTAVARDSAGRSSATKTKAFRVTR